MNGEFVDTNVLVYAHDLTAGAKRRAAVALLERLARERSGLLSTQVLAEFLVTVTRKIRNPLRIAAAVAIVEDFGKWSVFVPRVSDLAQAARTADRYSIHFWDALVIRSAEALGASVLWSEDLSPGQVYNGVQVRNPFE